MACYYLVISSTHLSNGHFRSIKGVFRGPLCGSNGGESPDYAEKETSITRALEDLKANFYCELCGKQYHRHQEFDNHINSYDHAHKQRLKELKQREFARNVSSKSWKDERKQERELRRLHHLALLKQQRDSSKGKSAKLRAEAREKRQEKVRVNRSNKAGTGPIPAQGQRENLPSPVVTPKVSTADEPSSHCSLRVQHSSPLPQTPKGPRRPRTGVSFCFFRRAHLKLDSCASVFSDALDDANDHQELQHRRQRLALQALRSRSSSPILGREDHDLPPDLAASNTCAQKGKRPDHVDQEPTLDIRTSCRVTRPEGRSRPDTQAPEAGRQPAGSEDGESERSQGLAGACRLWVERGSQTSPSPAASTDGAGRVGPGHPHTHTDSHQGSQKNHERDGMCAEDCLPERSGDDPSRRPLSFLNVLSRDGAMVRLPGELVRFTSDKPRLAFSCNPLGLGLENSESNESSAEAEEADGGANICGRPGRAEHGTRGECQEKSGISKLKTPKSKQRVRTRVHKIDPGRRLQGNSVPGGHCQTPGNFGIVMGKQGWHMKRRKFGKRRRRRRLLRGVVSNQSDTPGLSLKSVVVKSLAGPAGRKRRHQKLPAGVHPRKRGAPAPPGHCIAGYDDNQRWGAEYGEARRGGNTWARRDKADSWGVPSDLSSDGEWPGCQWEKFSPSPGSASSRPWKRGRSQPWSYVRKSIYDFPCYGYRHESDSPARGTEVREDYWDYRYSEIHRDRNYSDVYNSPCTVERTCSFRKRKRALDEDRCGECREVSTKRICVLRACVSPQPQDTESDWWCERFSPDHRKYRERDRFWSSPEIGHDRSYEGSPGIPRSRHSPASSSTTSISDLSGECGSHMKPSSSEQRQSNQRHRSGLMWPPERCATSKASNSSPREKHHSLTPTSTARPETMQTDNRLISDLGEKQQPGSPNSGSINLTKLSTTPGKKLAGNRSRTLLLPLIGKLPSMRRGIRAHKEKHSNSQAQKPASHVTSETGRVGSDGPVQAEELNANSSHTYPPTSDHGNSVTPEQKGQSGMSHENHTGTHLQTSEPSESNPPRRPTPPLTEKPITFTEEEIDKYRLLQLQAQQHMQQQQRQRCLQEQQSPQGQPMSTDMLPLSHGDAPESLNHVSYTTVPHETLSAFPSSSAYATSTQSAPLHPPLPHPSLTPLPLPTAFFPAPPTAMLATTHPLRPIPVAPLHPGPHLTGLVLHPLPHATLLPAMLAPTPIAAAVAMASTLHLHPLLHPLFHSQELQHQPGPAS